MSVEKIESVEIIENKNILLCITGSIAAYKACYLVRYLIKKKANVKVAMTKSAEKFISPLTLHSLSKNKVTTSLMQEEEDFSMGHIELARWADIVVIAPTSANTIAKLANGMADNIVTGICLATNSPIILAPAMNVNMWKNKIVQENCDYLQDKGFLIMSPSVGEQACGDFGDGCFSSEEDIYYRICSCLLPQIIKGKKVLVTAGGTKEMLDPVRGISNSSSGKMGVAMAHAFACFGAEVDLVIANSTVKSFMGINRVEVCSAKEMLCEVVKDPNKYDYFISAAAVSDFAPSTYSEIKIKDKNHQLQLVKNPDIIYNFNSYIEDSDCVVIGFAAETNNVLANGKQKLIDKKLDWILINDVSENRVFGHDYNEIHATNQGTCCEFKGNKFSIAVDIVQLICF